MVRIKWNFKNIEKWLKENREDITLIETKVMKKVRKVYLSYKGKEGWAEWGNIQKGFNPSFKKQAYTTGSFRKLLEEKYSNLELLEEFKGVKIQHRFYCKECEEYFENTPDNILTSKYGCSSCYLREKGKDRKRTQSEFEEVVYNLTKGEYIVLGEYIHSESKILLQHKLCGNKFKMKPNNFIQGQRCPECAKLTSGKPSKTNLEYVTEFESLYPNKYKLLSDYKNQLTRVEVEFLLCGHIELVHPQHLLRGLGCCECNSSSLEQNVMTILKKYNIKYKPQKTFDNCVYKSKLRFDFYLLKYNILIEVQGKQHYTPISHFGGFNGFIQGKFRDITKVEFCKKYKIPLIQIPYWNANIKDIENILKEYDII